MNRQKENIDAITKRGLDLYEIYMDPEVTPTDIFMIEHLTLMHTFFTKKLFKDLFGEELGRHLWIRYSGSGLWRLLMKADLSVRGMLRCTMKEQLFRHIVKYVMKEDSSLRDSLWAIEDLKSFEMSASYDDFKEFYDDEDLAKVWWSRYCRDGLLDCLMRVFNYREIYRPWLKIRDKYGEKKKYSIYDY